MRLIRVFIIFILSFCCLSSGYAGTLTLSTPGSGIDLSTPGGVILSSGPDAGIVLSAPGGIVLPAPDSGIVVTDGSGNNDLSQEITVPPVSYAYNIFVDGNMYLDYSLFGTNRDLFISERISLTAPNITIYSFDDLPAMPNLSDTTIFSAPNGYMNEVANILLFSEAPILNGAFAATGSLYIGDYSSLQPVPLPASAALLLFGLALLGGKAAANNRFSRDDAEKLVVC